MLILHRLRKPSPSRVVDKLDRWFERTILSLVNFGRNGIPGIRRVSLRYEFFTDIQEDLVKQGKPGLLMEKLFDLHIPECCKPGMPLFIHVLKCAGVSVSLALYGKHRDHHTAGYFQKLDPEFYSAVPTFAIMRDSVARTRFIRTLANTWIFWKQTRATWTSWAL